MKIGRKILFGSVILVILIRILIFFVDYQFKQLIMEPSFFNEDTQKFWPHKSYSMKGGQYSIESIQQAKKDGFKGVEIDIQYNRKLKTFLVAHDQTIIDTLLLEELLDVTKNELLYWFDLKYFEDQDEEEILLCFNRINEKYQLQNRFIIESKVSNKLKFLSEQGLNTCLWISTPNPEERLKFYFWNLKNKLAILNGDFNAISMPYDLYKKTDYQEYNHLIIHTWVGNDLLDLDRQKIVDDENLKIVLFDRI